MSEQTPSSGYGLSGASAGREISLPALPYFPPRPKFYRPKIALIGCGGISEYHLRAYRKMGLEVVALCDRDLARAEKRRDEFYPDAGVFRDAADILRRDEIEVVDLALHPAERVETIENALLAGKHVLSQKPFVLALAAGERLVALAEAKNRKLAVNQNGRWAPHFSYLAAAVDAGLVGEVASVDFMLQWDHTWTTGTAFEEMHHLVLFDFGIHWFDMVARLMPGRAARRVWASVEKAAFQVMKPPLLGHVGIDYAGAQVRLNFNGHVQHGQEDRTVVCGSRGTLRSFGPSLSEQVVTLDTAEGHGTARLDGTWFESGFEGAMGELLCAIEEDRPPGHSARQNLDTLALCFAALASADSGDPKVPGTERSVRSGSIGSSSG
jgi:predicted dehydrogenase